MYTNIYLYFIRIFNIYLLMAVLGLHCYIRAFSSCSKQGLLFITGLGLILVASLVEHTGFSSCGLQALDCGFSNHGIWAYLPQGMWNLPRSGIKSMFPALAGRFLTNGPPGKFLYLGFLNSWYKQIRTNQLQS